MADNLIESVKRKLSTTLLTFNQLRKSSFVFFLLFFISFFVFPLSNLSNRQYYFSELTRGKTLQFSPGILLILISVAIIHLVYLIYICARFYKINLLLFINKNRLRFFTGIVYSFIVFGLFFIFFKFLNAFNYQFSNLWRYIVLTNAILFLIYNILAAGVFLIIDYKRVIVHYKSLLNKHVFIKALKFLLSLMLLVLVLSPFLYFIESQLLSPNPFVNGTNYTSIVYFAVECLIDSVAAMFIYNNVELKIQHVNSELIHGRNFKRILLASLSIVYLFVWFTSGIIFQAMAKQSNGKDFIFQEDLSVSLQAKALKDVADIKADDYTVSSLIKQNELEKDVITFNKSGDNITNFVGSSKNNSSDINTYAKFDFSEPNGTLCVNTIGKYWAEFYSSDFYRKGITQYTYELGSGISVPEALGFKNNTLYPVTISLYKVNSDNTNFNFKEANNISLLGSNEDKNNYELVNKYTILIEDQGFIAELKSAAENKDNGRNPKISILSNMLQHSVLFIDNEYQKTNDMFNMVETQGIRYPLLDFLYYSAVTITTTGYGDILPNSRLIRTLVMFESFFGVGIPGLFISLLFFKVDHKEKKPVV